MRTEAIPDALSQGLYAVSHSYGRTVSIRVLRLGGVTPGLAIGIWQKRQCLAEATLSIGPSVSLIVGLLKAFKRSYGQEFTRRPRDPADVHVAVHVTTRAPVPPRLAGTPRGHVAPPARREA